MRKTINFLIDGVFIIPSMAMIAFFAALAFIPGLEGVYEEIRDYTIVLPVIMFLTAFTSWYLIRLYTFKLNKISKIEDINERLSAMEDLLNVYLLDQDDKEIAGTFVKSKMMILHMLAINYISNFEDYKIALTYLERAALLSVRLKINKSEIGFANNIADNCRLWEAIALSALGEYDSAERKIAPSLKHIKTLDPISKATVLVAQTDLATRRKDIATAREYNASLDTELRALATKFKKPEVIYDTILFDGILDKLEGKTESARAKLEDVLNNTPDEGNRLRAKRELEELT